MNGIRTLPVGISVALIAAFITLTAAPVSAHEESEVIVSRTAAGQLKVDIDFAQPLELDASIFPGISGYATGLLGVHSTILDDTNNDSFKLSTEADFRFILLAKDPGMEISVYVTNHFDFMNIGESFYIGAAPFDTHPIWNLAHGTPGSAYSLTLKIRDVNGVYPDSAPFTLSFTPAPIYQIQIKPENFHHATLLWPTNAADDWMLESAGSITATNWITVTNTPSISGTNFSLSIETISAQQFFRLNKQQ